ncbi:hypothetical protein ACFYWS_23600 [Streptomyces sp. NPDC002795]|uniref:hypothetical protein n=1 Tax=Streptomyces sp. NPDC002795 TaxID=3364665 RepID=UPI00368D25AF
MRPAEDQPGGHAVGDHAGGGPSVTPIYDALFAEWRRSFRTLPGDRSGEDDLGFRGFDPLHGPRPHHPPRWQPYPQQHTTGRHFPALPPGPRREH